MALFKKAEPPKTASPRFEQDAVGTAQRDTSSGFFRTEGALGEKELYYRLRENVPIIDACIEKIIRLIGGFRAVSSDESLQDELDRFSRDVKIGASGNGLNTFLDCCMDSLLTSGSALAEIIPDENFRGVSGVYVAPMRKLDVRKKGVDGREYYLHERNTPIAVSRSENLIFLAHAPTPEQPFGVSILRGLPSLSAILLRIYDCVGQNFDRVGNVRYAVTYKPSGDAGDRAFAKERAQQIAKEWSAGMSASKAGDVRDFVAVGDVSVRAIGADNQILDTEIPVRQLLEQLISKLGIPPYLLGLSWSTSERMSSQQADILTSELEYYRRLMSPALEKICGAHLRLLGGTGEVRIDWDNINLQDETELALARLRNAQARAIELSNIKEEQSIGVKA